MIYVDKTETNDKHVRVGWYVSHNYLDSNISFISWFSIVLWSIVGKATTKWNRRGRQMDPESVREVDRVPHGGADEHDVLDFSANVNPEHPEGLSHVYETALYGARSYPADDYSTYRVAAGEYLGCEPRDVVPTAGGLAAIRLVTEVSVESGDRALVPYPSFGEYAREVRLQGGEPEFVPYAELPNRDPENYALAVVCNPNNPTGDAYADSELRSFAERCREAGTTLLVDEAYLGFTDRPSMAGEDGVVVTRSPGKLFGLPGIRVGCAVATGELYDAIETARPTWNLSTPASDVATYCMRQSSFVRRTRERIHHERARLADALSTEFDVYPSESPFLLFDVGGRDPTAVIEHAREQGVVVRDATTFRGLDNHVRIAVRRAEENDQLLRALRVRDRRV